MTDYSKFLIKDYPYWTVFINVNQSYLGRCVVWCKREDALDLAEATLEEQEELFIVLNSLKKVVENTFGADWINYAFLGNETQHLHCHFIPRYSKSINFMDITFEDKLWGHNYKTNPDFNIPDSILQAIQEKIRIGLEVL